MQSLTASKHPHTDQNVDKITLESFDACCLSKGIELICTPRVRRKFHSYVIEAIVKLNETKRTHGPQLDQVVQRFAQRKPWKCLVYAIEFPNKEHFQQTQREYLQHEIDPKNGDDGVYILVDRGFVLDISQKNQHLCNREVESTLRDEIQKSQGMNSS